MKLPPTALALKWPKYTDNRSIRNRRSSKRMTLLEGELLFPLNSHGHHFQKNGKNAEDWR